MFRSYASPLFLVSVIVFAFVASAACGETIDEKASAAGGTGAPDGADGYCCPASTGGCAQQGGFHTDGKCSDFWICDNMCEQKIVKDEHGCDTLTYKQPPVSTTFAGTGSCSAPVFNGGEPDSGTDARVDADADSGGDANADADAGTDG